MRYLIRSAKYFIQVTLLLLLILTALVLLGFVSPDVNVMFSDGWKSVWMILGFFLLLSLIYPSFGYKRMRIEAPADRFAELADGILEERGYRRVGQSETSRSYSLRNPFARLFRFYEDRVRFDCEFGSWYIEGLSRDIVRLKNSLEYQLQFPQ